MNSRSAASTSQGLRLAFIGQLLREDEMRNSFAKKCKSSALTFFVINLPCLNARSMSMSLSFLQKITFRILAPRLITRPTILIFKRAGALHQAVAFLCLEIILSFFSISFLCHFSQCTNTEIGFFGQKTIFLDNDAPHEISKF
jgi:hypothetical protein